VERAKQYSSYLEAMPQEKKAELTLETMKQHKEEHSRFLESYAKDECYLCNKNFKTYSKANPCLHWLLRRAKFKKKDFPLLTSKYDYHQINMYLRWVANAEYYQKNINDMKSEQSEKKVFQSTIKWKNIEWSFECSENDFKGHPSAINYPHYHFQMMVDKKIFINYNGFHNRFSQQDLSYLYAIYSDGFTPMYGTNGSGMEDAMSANPEDLLDRCSVIDEGQVQGGAFHIQSMISNPDGIDGDVIQDAIEESRKTKKSLTKILKEKLSDDTNITTIISPSERVPEIAKRTEHKPRKS